MAKFLVLFILKLNLFFPVGIQVVSIKAIGIAVKLTLEGISQIAYPQTWLFVTVAVVCVIAQLNYLNKVSTMCILLDLVIHIFDVSVS